MLRFISFRRAAKVGLFLFGFFTVFHFLIIISLLVFEQFPVDFLWGGRLESRQELLGFEIISMIVMAFGFFVVYTQAGKIRQPALVRMARIGIWFFTVLFAFNTIGNLMAKTTFEKYFAIATTVLALTCLRVALGKSDHE